MKTSQENMIRNSFAWSGVGIVMYPFMSFVSGPMALMWALRVDKENRKVSAEVFAWVVTILGIPMALLWSLFFHLIIHASFSTDFNSGYMTSSVIGLVVVYYGVMAWYCRKLNLKAQENPAPVSNTRPRRLAVPPASPVGYSNYSYPSETKLGVMPDVQDVVRDQRRQ